MNPTHYTSIKYSKSGTILVKKMEEAYKTFETLVNPIGDYILEWARPDGRPVGPTTVSISTTFNHTFILLIMHLSHLIHFIFYIL